MSMTATTRLGCRLGAARHGEVGSQIHLVPHIAINGGNGADHCGCIQHMIVE